MVCTKCEKKLAKLACPDKWKEGSNNKSNERKLNENKLLTKKKRYEPYSNAAKCKICKTGLHQQGLYCHGCAYQRGVCAMCGKQVLDTTGYKQSCA